MTTYVQAFLRFVHNIVKPWDILNIMIVYLGLKQCGSLNLAQTKERMIALKRRIAYNSPTGLHCEVSD